MGGCVSRSSAVSDTTKLILPNGTLEEFNQRVEASSILRRNPGCFVCNCDEMEFDRVASALAEEDELQLGQIYFVLPRTWLKSPLRPEEMAKLAVKASSVLVKNGAHLRTTYWNQKPIFPEASSDDLTECGSGRPPIKTRLSAIAE